MFVQNETARKILTGVLALAGIGTMWYYAQCTDSCAYLTGDVFGIDLKYLGIGYMVVVIALAAAGWDALLRMVLAAGIGGEIFLFGFQVSERVFCPYCLVFAGALILAFIVNYRLPTAGKTGWQRWAYLLGDIEVPVRDRTEVLPLSLVSLAGFAFFVIAFTGTTTPSYAAEQTFPAVYGQGPVEVRIYSDYFCPPCQSLEERSEKLIDRIVAQKKARVVFIDTPFHQWTPLYARYFLYATWNEPGFERAMKVRKLLFSAAKADIKTETGLINYLKSNGIRFSLTRTNEYFQALDRYLKEDKVRFTPTAIIVSAQGKTAYPSGNTALKALEDLSK